MNDSQAMLPEYDNLLDYFVYYLFPFALKIGMTPEQFWNENPDLMGAYLEAYKQKQEEKMAYDNNFAFLQGQYIMLAIGQCLQGKPVKKIYPKEPFKLGTKKNKAVATSQKEYEEIRKIQLQQMVKRFNNNK